MKKFFVLLAIIISGWFLYPRIIEHLPYIKKGIQEYIPQIKKEFSAPGPLKYTGQYTGANLTVSGTLKWTNQHRQENSLVGLSLNEKLNLAAQDKLKDMFARQYFAHYGPGHSSGAGELAEKRDYDYIAIGENLALGNFKDDQDLVQAWMDSPGHRANILNSKFQEIGIAVGRGTFEGRSTWIAVQIFAKPSSSCPRMDDDLKNQIENNKAEIDRLKAVFDVKKAELESYEPKRGAEYNKKVDDYNATAEEYNALIKDTKTLVDMYNEQVRQYNSCIES